MKKYRVEFEAVVEGYDEEDALESAAFELQYADPETLSNAVGISGGDIRRLKITEAK